MSDRTPPPPPPPPQPPRSWREMRREERWQRREARWGTGGGWMFGAILILLGVLFLLRNMGYELPSHWWALFLLIPAAASFYAAWATYQREGVATAPVRGGIIGGAILVLLTLAFLIDFEWGRYWPVVLILLGVAAIGTGMHRR